ncbi:hypothetical protein [Lactobacillus sp. 3B(2020)]|uniref:hypothetical protein n=1 Tax=Lactobacillus sp. 3B(2020) TaxID=2695882 RepID=UPI0015DEB477|nr:hypothetical protein [Lactobacillus sp. 3B(2020)]QLL69597.1 hypothetical protein GTO83_03100 [Lactobacillus sp. 3B(2020)]
MASPEEDILSTVKSALKDLTVPSYFEGHKHLPALPYITISLSSVQEQHQLRTKEVIKATLAIDLYIDPAKTGQAYSIGRDMINRLQKVQGKEWWSQYNDYSLRTLQNEINGQPVLRLAFLVDYLIYSIKRGA